MFVRMVFALSLVFTTLTSAFAEDGESGFKSLFDGKSMTGWQGSTDGYAVEDGAIVCIPKKGGFLYTNDQYADFVFRFEFQLTPGANNGIGIRTPISGDPAYVGMEIQVLDNTSPRYAKLKPYQYHGSIYGVAAAKRGHLKPVGKWNTEEISCQGDHVTIKLNGVTIVDANIREASTPQTVDHRKHPGLKREQGYLCFCGHGARVAFRHIRIKTLNSNK